MLKNYVKVFLINEIQVIFDGLKFQGLRKNFEGLKVLIVIKSFKFFRLIDGY